MKTNLEFKVGERDYELRVEDIETRSHEEYSAFGKDTRKIILGKVSLYETITEPIAYGVFEKIAMLLHLPKTKKRSVCIADGRTDDNFAGFLYDEGFGCDAASRLIDKISSIAKDLDYHPTQYAHLDCPEVKTRIFDLVQDVVNEVYKKTWRKERK